MLSDHKINIVFMHEVELNWSLDYFHNSKCVLTYLLSYTNKFALVIRKPMRCIYKVLYLFICIIIVLSCSFKSVV